MAVSLGVTGQTRLRFCGCTPTQLSVPVAAVIREREAVVLVRTDLPVRDILADAALILSASEQAGLLRWLERTA